MSTRLRPTSAHTRSTARSREATSSYATAAEDQALATVERAVDEEMARFLRDGPTRAELERVRAELKGSFVRGIEQVGGFRGKSNILAENAVFGGRPISTSTRST
jgi:hypothetical protein